MGKNAKPVSWLIDNLDKVNLVDDLEDRVINKISTRVLNGYELDLASCSEWHKKTEDGLKVAKQIAEKKTFPWPGAANIKFPLIATASIQFAARAYPQIIQGNDIVRATVVGSDDTGAKEQRAKRVSQHMSWQLLDQMEEWEPGMDQLLHGLPVMGTYFKKTFFDPLYQRNRSIALTPFEVVVNIKHKGTLETCRRISQQIYLYKNEVIERENAGIYRADCAEHMTNQVNDDESVQELFIEQHCWYDLDGDGYEEPYIVTLHHDSGYICRILANYDAGQMDVRNDKLVKIEPIPYFTKFTFIPSPDGEFYDIGFAHLLGPINEAMSTLINQLLDAGSLANTGGGFISKGLRWNGGRLSFELGEWKPVDTVGMSLKDAILPLPVREPSSTLFQLLGLLNDTGQKLASVSDAMAGEMPSQNTTATTTLAMIEQGLKVFTGIYKRVFRSLKQEFAKLYRLNSVYLEEEEYFRVMDSQMAVFQKDYALDDLDIVPVADPTMASEAQRLARAQALLQTMEMNPDPMGKIEILRQYYDAIGAKNIDQLLNVEQIKQQMENPPPNPDMLRLQLETQKAKDTMDAKLHELEHAETELQAKVNLLEKQADLLTAQTMKTIAEAEAVEPGMQFEQYKMQVAQISEERKMELEHKKLETAAQQAQIQPTGQPSQSQGQSVSGVSPNEVNIRLGIDSPKAAPTKRRVKVNRDANGDIESADLEDVLDEGEGSTSETSEGMSPQAILPALKAETTQGA
jgi:chaperonin GroES